LEIWYTNSADLIWSTGYDFDLIDNLRVTIAAVGLEVVDVV